MLHAGVGISLDFVINRLSVNPDSPIIESENNWVSILFSSEVPSVEN